MHPIVRSLAAASLLGFALPSPADVLGASIGAGFWRAAPSGELEDENGNRADVDDELGLDAESTGFLWVAFEHPLPVLPNVKLQYTPLSFEGEGNLESTFTVFDQTFAVNEAVTTDAELNQFDLIFYYELLDDGLNLDVGVNIKVVDARIEVTSQTTGDTARESLTAPLPLLYLHGAVDLPLDLTVGLEASGLAYSGNRVIDARAYLGYTFAKVFTIEGGWRHLQIKLDDIDDASLDLQVSGPYAGVSLDF